jgi:hypothetical protein
MCDDIAVKLADLIQLLPTLREGTPKWVWTKQEIEYLTEEIERKEHD